MEADDFAGEEQEITIRLPRNLVQRLEHKFATKERNRFIRDVVEQQLSLEEQFAALEETAASWLEEADQADTAIAEEDEILSWLNDVGRSDNNHTRP